MIGGKYIMKYLKITLGVFVIAMVLSVTGVQAQVVKLVDITIPTLSKTYIKKAAKTGFNTQYIKKTKCNDDVSGDGRAILAGLHETTGNGHPDGDPAWVTATLNNKISFGVRSQNAGSWNLYLKSNKSLLTTASFWGEWTVD